MKLEPKFVVKNNSLFTLDSHVVSPNAIKVFDFCALNTMSQDDALQKVLSVFSTQQNKISAPCITKISLSYKDVAVLPQESAFNEETLATLRNLLKTLGQNNIFTIIEPTFNNKNNEQSSTNTPFSTEEFEMFTQTFKHCARRIKDCECTIGFVLNNALYSSNNKTQNITTFINELSEKHEHYLYGASNALIEFAKKQEISALDKIFLL